MYLQDVWVTFCTVGSICRSLYLQCLRYLKSAGTCRISTIFSQVETLSTAGGFGVRAAITQLRSSAKHQILVKVKSSRMQKKARKQLVLHTPCVWAGASVGMCANLSGPLSGTVGSISPEHFPQHIHALFLHQPISVTNVICTVNRSWLMVHPLSIFCHFIYLFTEIASNHKD